MTISAAATLREALRGRAGGAELRLVTLAYLETSPGYASWHPYGFVKFRLSADPEERVSVHVWHPRIRQPQTPPHICHSHGWLLESNVVAGTLVDQRYTITPSPDGDACLFEVQYEADTSVARKTSSRVAVEFRDRAVYPVGSRYRIPRDDFHTTELPTDVTVTVIQNIDDPAQAGCTIRSLGDPDVIRYRRGIVPEIARQSLVADAIAAIRLGP